jgi:hypothetical protein
MNDPKGVAHMKSKNYRHSLKYAVIVSAGILTIAVSGVWRIRGIGLRRVFQTIGALMPTREYRFHLNAQANFGRENLRQVLAAIGMYHDKYGVLPYHPNGSDHALFLLRDRLNPSCLATTPANDAAEGTWWDARSEQARNCGWEYLNEKDVRVFDPSQIVVMSKRVNNWKTVLVGLKYDLVLFLEFEEYPGRLLLGANVMSDYSIQKLGTVSWIKNPGGLSESSPTSRVYREVSMRAPRY